MDFDIPQIISEVSFRFTAQACLLFFSFEVLSHSYLDLYGDYVDTGLYLVSNRASYQRLKQHNGGGVFGGGFVNRQTPVLNSYVINN